MKDKWGTRVYIDLYAGAGFSKIEGTGRVLKGSPILALTVQHPFDKYIFCEEDADLLTVLSQRTKRIAPAANVAYVQGNCNAEIDKICSLIPRGSAKDSVLSLCFADPFDFGIKHETIRSLSRFRMDFLVLLAIGMDANRNYDHYVDGPSPKIDEALGNKKWRERWQQRVSREEFSSFLALEFAESMNSLGYLPRKLDQMKQVRSAQKNLPLYHLALFSKAQRAYTLWEEVLKYGTAQKSLGFEG